MKTFLLSIIFASSVALGLPLAVHAEPLPASSTSKFNWDGKITIQDNIEEQTISGTFTRLINWMLAIIALVSTVMIIYSGLLLVVNAGNEARIKTAKATLTWAIIGLVVAVGAFAIVAMIQGVLS